MDKKIFTILSSKILFILTYVLPLFGSYLVEEMQCFIHSKFTDIDVFLLVTLRFPLTVGERVQHTAVACDRLQGHNLVQWGTEYLQIKRGACENALMGES